MALFENSRWNRACKNAHWAAVAISHELLDDAEPLILKALRTFLKLDPELEAEDSAMAVGSLGLLRYKQGREVEAEAAFLRSVQALEAITYIIPDPGALATMRGLLGTICYEQGRLQEAEVHYLTSLKILMSEKKKDAHTLAEVNKLLGLVYLQTDRFAESEKHYLEALARYKRASKKTSEEVDPFDIVAVTRALGVIYFETGKLPESERYLVRALELCREQESVPDWLLLESVTTSLAAVYVRLGRPQDARPLLLESMKLHSKFGNESTEQRLAHMLEIYGACLGDLGFEDDAEKRYRLALRIRRNPRGQYDPKAFARTCANFGGFYSDRGRFAEAEELLNDAFSAYREIGALAVAEATAVADNLGTVYLKSGRLVEADELLSKTLTLVEQNVSYVDQRSIADLRVRVASTKMILGQFKEAEEHFNHARELIHQIDGGDDVRLVRVIVNLGILFSQSNRLDEAEQCLDEGRALFAALDPQMNKRWIAEITGGLGMVAARLGLLSEAEKYWAETLESYQSIWGVDPRQVARIIALLGMLNADRDEFERAHELLANAITRIPDDTWHLRAQLAVIHAYVIAELGRVDDAAELIGPALVALDSVRFRLNSLENRRAWAKTLEWAFGIAFLIMSTQENPDNMAALITWTRLSGITTMALEKKTATHHLFEGLLGEAALLPPFPAVAKDDTTDRGTEESGGITAGAAVWLDPSMLRPLLPPPLTLRARLNWLVDAAATYGLEPKDLVSPATIEI